MELLELVELLIHALSVLETVALGLGDFLVGLEAGFLDVDPTLVEKHLILLL